MILWRIAAGFFLAMAIAAGARATRALSPGGAFVATLIGTLAVMAGWTWGLLLIAYFLSSSLLSRWRARDRDRLTGPIVAKGGERDGMQVLSNGGGFALGAVLATMAPGEPWFAFAMGSLAASASDTWATEVGSVVGGTPRHVFSWQKVRPGTSGGVTIAGTVASLAGAALMAGLTVVATDDRTLALPVFLGGVAGSTIDTLLGAGLQGRRRCDQCNEATERLVHGCGAETRVSGGMAWMNNDVVNLLSGLAGGLLAFVLVR